MNQGQNHHHHSPSLTVIQGDGVPSPEQIVGARNLNGKRGLIIGMGLGGIAQGCLVALSAYGAQLAVASINQKVLDHCEAFIDRYQLNVAASLTCDVSRSSDVDILFSSLRSATGWDSIDFVIFSVAGADKHEIKNPLSEATYEGMDKAMRTSAYPLIPIAENCKSMMPNGGSVISIGYEGGERVIEHYDVMGPAKACMNSMSNYLAFEHGHRGIRFNVVSPGPIATRAASGLPSFGSLLQKSEDMAMLKKAHVDIYDVGQAVAFMVSDAALHVTAEIFHVDLGTHAVGMNQGHHLETVSEVVQAAKQA
ncbi:MAG: SDR family oxidoreductase [Patescibacteria group bacterium]